MKVNNITTFVTKNTSLVMVCRMNFKGQEQETVQEIVEVILEKVDKKFNNNADQSGKKKSQEIIGVTGKFGIGILVLQFVGHSPGGYGT